MFIFQCLSTKFVGEFLSDRPKMSLGFGFDLNWIAWDEQSCSNHARCPQNKLVLCSLLFLLFSFSVTIFFFYELHKSNFYGEHFFLYNFYLFKFFCCCCFLSLTNSKSNSEIWEHNLMQLSKRCIMLLLISIILKKVKKMFVFSVFTI